MRRAYLVLVAAWLVIFGACGDLACGAGLPSPSDQAITAEETAAEAACVINGAPKDDAGIAKAAVDQCRCSVKTQYHHPCDAGAP